MKSYFVIPHVCAFCRQYFNDDGTWRCRKDRACGDVCEGTQWMTACKGWRQYDDSRYNTGTD